ncbi:hypothetical protein Hypma_001836 [Hypsizygus marmoreus]|uniref:F-box domain-containing protein n=1 Tax=Hypsizygus marmoreus TaxID=39966 RepID=A0A369J5Y7_HYPMA|nr:hypothetical protein Hypma_001836 [Hypsizygus marmoreus]
MHRCLGVLDVLQNIFSLVFQSPTHGSMDLAQLAVTCQLFRAPALDILWRTLPNLAPLIRCIPDDAWSLVGNYLSLRRTVADSEWARCNIYAPLVRRLGYASHPTSCTGDIILDPKIFEILSVKPIISFSNLQELRWRADRTTMPWIHTLLGPQLFNLDLDLPAEDPNFFIPVLINSLKRTVPCLQQLRLSQSSTSRTDLSRIFSSLFSDLNRLEVISCGDFVFPDDAIRSLVVSPTLRVLCTKNDAADFLWCLPGIGLSFPQLQHLSMQTKRLQDCSALLRRIETRQLKCLDVISTYQPSAARVHGFFQTLEERCSHSLLSIIKLQQLEPEPPIGISWATDEFITPTTTKPLLSFQNLEELSITVSCPVDFDDSGIESMAVAWPKMTIFQLGNSKGWGRRARTTLDIYISVAKHWPRLKYLSICFTCHTEAAIYQRPGNGHCCPRVTVLNGTSSAEDMHSGLLASFLSDIFPNLELIRSGYVDETWLRVEELLRTVHAVRAQERSWGSRSP